MGISSSEDVLCQYRLATKHKPTQKIPILQLPPPGEACFGSSLLWFLEMVRLQVAWTGCSHFPASANSFVYLLPSCFIDSHFL